MNKKVRTALSILPAIAFATSSLTASPIYPSSDVRVQDATGDGHGNHSHAEDATHEVLNVGDNAENKTWRSIVKFDLAEHAAAIEKAPEILFQITVRNRLIQVPKDWTFEVVAFPSEFPEAVLVSPAADRTDDYSIDGEVIYSAAAGTLQTGAVMQLDVTQAVKAAAAASGVLALRLQLDPTTNEDNHEDQVSFYAGSHEVNTPHLRPQLVINP